MSKKGFTLVELMVVIVIIGVLAAVAIPRMMAATNKAKAAEGPQILGTISRMQHAVRAEHSVFIAAAAAEPTVDLTDGWALLGFDRNPNTKYFTFGVTVTGTVTKPSPIPAAVDAGSAFIATATLKNALGSATQGATLTINQDDVKTANLHLNRLVGSFGATNQ